MGNNIKLGAVYAIYLKMAAIKFGPQLKELRILLCQTSKSSQGVRDFIKQQYVPLKRSNPQFPVLIRECSDTEPVLYARYELGVERRVSLQNLKSEEILKCIQELATSKPK
ncbi:NADH dehydrogenase [ubiquinone] 1 alpha subcomplex subunit 2 isoform X2 [Bombus affinis]|uniref:NADH dehydrogenase [ubiquinone] 1 alpha subcomplex subunit 2 isoform X2 n=1 Tax=Bombus affinis TaxID=309941 RepID=UPI0021B80EA0|nr:NADH dehydrogenase [ubiquinone] 1 alpha subcomplex subunit 2 isoform X2 [Bombus affinis]XP_050593965.1 NADH dehydrogenase [ubiquinone] 1 alpha subcomplex subunit 2 isoform X2 [Bombus affinis]XP_050593974.1 NADH dehydrogenase [ubiquinone] 1 alpha subcomplex subunit 2 isoform X2 [Bombus affinis]XP_050593985.1 NADH dehydrogenase [ubiquinone] 1 alpha subcomplex subunit 2 isoform X2 [Bombus affinis]XP_050593996.1 NADH dehydrogenase [ubiquinone] 1 alpha subcomplex subunit 2 isoform X2 [Bombus affi